MTKSNINSNQRYESGVTILELIFTLVLLSILLGIAIPNIRVMTRPLNDGAASCEQFLQLVRARAISGTAVYKVSPESSSQIGVTSGPTCATSTTTVSDLQLKLPSGSTLVDTSWYVCFNARGRADANISFQLSGTDGGTKTVSIALGGGVKVS